MRAAKPSNAQALAKSCCCSKPLTPIITAASRATLYNGNAQSLPGLPPSGEPSRRPERPSPPPFTTLAPTGTVVPPEAWRASLPAERLVAKASTAATGASTARLQKEVSVSSATTAKPTAAISHHLTRASAADTYQARATIPNSSATGKVIPNQLWTALPDEATSKRQVAAPLSKPMTSSGHSQPTVIRGFPVPAVLEDNSSAGIKR